MWLLITFVSILFYLVSAWAYQQVLLSEPFLGSTSQESTGTFKAQNISIRSNGFNQMTGRTYSVAGSTDPSLGVTNIAANNWN